MTTVFIDTNIVMNESFIRSANARAFFKACTFLGISVVIPEIVIDEAMGNYPKSFADRLSSYKKATRELAKLVDIDEPKFSVEEATAAYKDWLDNFLEEHGVHVIPYPGITPKELVIKSYENKKPFKNTGEGHKDYIVWESIKKHIEGKVTPAPNYFLENNSNDFCQETAEKKMVLHPDLANQIGDEALRPVVFLSIRGFFDEIVAPNLPGIALDAIPHFGMAEIDALAKEKLEAELSGYTAYGFEGVPFSNEVYVNMAGEATIENRELKKIDDEIVIAVRGTVMIEVEGYMDKHAYYSEDFDEQEIAITDPDWNDWVMAVSTTVDTTFELRLFYSPDEKKVVGHSLVLPQEYDSEYPYK